MATILSFGGATPRIAPGVFLAPTAVLIGDVTIEAEASVWFGAVLRADLAPIVVGAGSNVQDNAVLHCSTDLPTVVGAGVTIGHQAMLEGCVVEDDSLVGMGAMVLQRARVGAGSLLAAGAVVPEGREIPPGVLAAGVPAEVKRSLDGPGTGERAARAARTYRSLAQRYLVKGR